MWIDSHCHLDSPEFDVDRDEVVAASRAAGVEAIVNLPGHVDHFARALASRERYGCLTGFGIHPMWVAGPSAQSPRDHIAILRSWVEREKPDLIGEIGLDFYISDVNQSEQEWFFSEQLKVAREFDLPVSLHVRRSQDVILKHLRRIRVRSGFAHAFNGSSQQAMEFVRLGFCLGFGGTATFPQARRIRSLLRDVPLSSVVLETDAPDLPPSFLGAMSSTRRNSPEYLPAIGELLARERGELPAAFAAATTSNVRRVLGAD
ncbi:MAG: TatD family hydrolase [Burkholderiales bacterium]|nr:TatD family hydrolase [Burkholderiales bacterium]